jgi:hypothetical protein
MDVIGREVDNLLFGLEHDLLSDPDTDDDYGTDITDPDDIMGLEDALENAPFDVDELLDQLY